MEDKKQKRNITVNVNLKRIKEVILTKTITNTLPFNYFKIKKVSEKQKDNKELHQSIAHSNLVNIYKDISPCDISSVDYTNGGTNNNKLEPLCNLFCDNMVFYYYFPDNNKYEGREKLEIAKEYLAQHTLKIKRLLAEQDIHVSKPDIKPLGITDKIKNYPQKEGQLIQRIKVALADVEIKKIVSIITSKEKIKNLEEQGIYLSDVDFTRDFMGVINKKKLKDYLLELDNFTMEGDYGEREYTVLDNGKYVSNNCLTFIGKGEYGTIRFKLYNKFVQSMESPSVREKIGNHISDWCNNPQKILNNSIKQSLETGLLRLEITYYFSEKVPTENYFKHNFNFLESIIPENQIYYNPISAQWRLLLDKVGCNILLWDTTNNCAFLGYYYNKLTSKVNGCFISNPTTNSISNVIKLYTFNTPIAFITLNYNYENLCVNLNSRMFTKHLLPTSNKKLLQELTTYLTTGAQNLKAAIKQDDFVDPSDRGIVNQLVNFQYGSKGELKRKTDGINIDLEELESTIIFPKISKQTTKTINTIEEVNTEEVSKLNNEREEKRKELKEKLKADKEIITKYNDILDIFKDTRYASFKNLVDMENGSVLTVKAIKFVNLKLEKGDVATVNLLVKMNEEEDDVIVKGNTFVNNYCRNNVDKWCLIADNIFAVLDSYCFKIKKIGNNLYNKHPYAKVEIEENSDIIKEIGKTKDFIKLKKEKLNLEFTEKNINPTECIKIEDLINDGVYNVGDILELHNYWHYRRNYLLKISKNGKFKYVVANTFLKEIVQDVFSSCYKEKISVVIGNKAQNSSSKRSEYVFLRSEEDKRYKVEDTIEEDRKKHNGIVIEEHKKAYGEIKEYTYFDTLKDATLKEEINKTKPIREIIKENTTFKPIACIKVFGKYIKKPLLKINISGEDFWIKCDTKLGNQIWNSITQDSFVAYNYNYVNNAISRIV